MIVGNLHSFNKTIPYYSDRPTFSCKVLIRQISVVINSLFIHMLKIKPNLLANNPIRFEVDNGALTVNVLLIETLRGREYTENNLKNNKSNNNHITGEEESEI